MAGKKGTIPANKGKFKYEAAELAEKIKSYFAECDDSEGIEKYYSRYGLADYLDISYDTLCLWETELSVTEDMTDSDRDRVNRHNALSAVLKKANTKICSQVERRTDAKSMFLAKQAKYMGYADRDPRQDNSPIAITVEFKPQK